MHRTLVALSLCLSLLGAPSAWSQSPFIYGRAIGAYPDLSFPSDAKEMGIFSSMSNGIFRPAGQGPFPAVVLAHTCGGLQPHMTDRAKELLAAGFVVLVLDAYGPRGHTAYCQPRGVLAPRFYKDAFDGLKHLAQIKDVDRERIYLVGLSLGSFVASSAASPEIARLVGSQARFRATVGWYGSCAFDVSPQPKWQLIHPDTDRPVLLLLAGKDTETPIAECFPTLEQLKSEGKPVAWHVYADATHGWDKSDPRRGYVYSPDVTKDAMQRTVEFLRSH